MHKKDPLKRFGLSSGKDGRPPKKVLARRWMFDMYRSISGNTCLPTNLQYWTLSGQIVCEDNHRCLQTLCEPYQAIQEGLIRPTQYIGVDHCQETYAANKTQEELRLTLEYGEIEDVMLRYLERGDFAPGIINLDTTHGPDRAISALAQLNRVLRRAPSDPLIIFLNLQMGRIWNGIATDRDADVVSAIKSSLGVSGMLLNEGWQLLPATWRYEGTGSGSRSSMRIYCFSRGYVVDARCVA